MNKKFALLLALLASLAIGAGSAAAADIKATGTWSIDAYMGQNWDFNKQTEDKTFEVEQRMRTALQFIANENLKAVLETQIGTNNWGNGLYSIGAGRSASTANPNNTGANQAGYGNIMLRKGYVDFNWPGTKFNFKVGFQPISLPAAMGGGSAILDDQLAAAVATIPVNDMLTFVTGYGRLMESQTFGSGTSVSGHGTAADAALLIADVKAGGFQVTPFFMYANAGRDVAGTGGTSLVASSGFAGPNSSLKEGTRAYWGGVAFNMTALDPFKVMADFNYGKATYNNQSAGNGADGGRSGYLFDIGVDYTGLSMVTPELFFVYTSGEDGNSTKGSGKSERMPIVATPQNFAFGSFWMQGGDSINASMNSSNTTMGFWALGLSFKDIKLIDKLSHTVHFIYFQGTNDEDYLKETSGSVRGAAYGQFLTKKDSLFEVDVNSKYQVYDQLALMLELGYINANFDKDVWYNARVATGLAGTRSDLSKDAYKAALILQYSF